MFFATACIYFNEKCMKTLIVWMIITSFAIFFAPTSVEIHTRPVHLLYLDQIVFPSTYV